MRKLYVNCLISNLELGRSLMGIRLIDRRLFLGMIILNTESNMNIYFVTICYLF
jgi:hypothetical protein